jgi:hypothetical protein
VQYIRKYIYKVLLNIFGTFVCLNAMQFSVMSCSAEGVFLDVIGTKILILLLHAVHSHLHLWILLPHMVFLDLDFYSATAESWCELGFVYIISLFTFESSIVLSLVTLFYI